MELLDNRPEIALPCKAAGLIQQRPPMLVVDRLLERDRENNSSRVEAVLPATGFFVRRDAAIVPELLVELIAQAMAAVNGYDALVDQKTNGVGFLVGVDHFVWHSIPAPGERVIIDLEKKMEFGPVTIMAGRMADMAGRVVAEGEIRAWEVDK